MQATRSRLLKGSTGKRSVKSWYSTPTITTGAKLPHVCLLERHIYKIHNRAWPKNIIEMEKRVHHGLHISSVPRWEMRSAGLCSWRVGPSLRMRGSIKGWIYHLLCTI